MFSSFSPRMCHRVCRGNPKGLSQRSHLFRRQGQQCSPLKGNMERSTGISLGSHWAILCCSQHGQTALGPVVCCCWVSLLCLLWEDFKPCAAIKISVFIYLFSPLSSFWAVNWTAFPLKLQLCDKHNSRLLLHHFTENNCTLAVCIALFDRGCWCDPQLCEHLSRWEGREDFCAVVFIFPPS